MPRRRMLWPAYSACMYEWMPPSPRLAALARSREARGVLGVVGSKDSRYLTAG